MAGGASQRNFRREIEQLQGEKNTPTLGGHENAAGVVRSNKGDDEAQWNKNPPFPTDLSGYTGIQSLAAAIEGPPIDVRDFNVFTLYASYTLGAAEVATRLEYVPFAQGIGDFDAAVASDAWLPVSVVDQTLAVVGVEFFRDVGQMAFRTPIGLAFTIVQSFDVSAFTGFRFAFDETGVVANAGTLDSNYNLSL